VTKEKLHSIVERTGGRKFSVNEWGSCQYTTAINMFDTLEHTKAFLRKKKKKVITNNDVLKKLDLTVAYKRITPLEEAWKKFEKEMIEYIEEMGDPTWWEDVKKELKEATPSVDAMFEIAKHQSWDLWSTAPYIANIMFENLRVGKVPKASGVGPIGNVLAQEENLSTGLHCWLLWNERLVKDQKAFAEFDT
jgi:hypothetical protein